MERKYLTLEELKEFLGVNHQTIYNFRKSRGLPYIKIGSTVRYDRDDVVAWMSQFRCVDSVSTHDIATAGHEENT